MISKRTVLIAAQRPSDFVEMKRCALALKNQGWSVQFVYFCSKNYADEEVVKYLIEQKKQQKLSCVKIRDNGIVRNPKQSINGGLFGYKKNSVYKRCIDFVWSRIIVPVKKRAYDERSVILNKLLKSLEAIQIISFYFKEENSLKEMLNNLGPDVVILPEDVVGYNSPLLIKAAHDLNIPVIVLPYTIANEQEAFRSLAGNPSYHLSAFGNRTVGKLFPKWVMTCNGLSLVRLPSPYILGQVLTRTSPPNPWMMNSGFSNMIAIESEAMKQYYLASGLPETKIAVVGAISDDHLAKFKFRRFEELTVLRSELGLEGDKPILVIGGCPDQTGTCPPGFEYDSYSDFIIHLTKELKNLKRYYDVIFRPHPNNLEVCEVVEANEIKSTQIDTARLIAVANVYIAFASATIRWAIACEVPVVNYDLFHYNYDDFKGVPGVVHVDTHEKFKIALQGLVPTCQKFIDLQDDVKISAPRWGMLDGNSTDRIVGLIDEICEEKKVKRTSV